MGSARPGRLPVTDAYANVCHLEACDCDGALLQEFRAEQEAPTETDQVLRRARRLLGVIIANDAWVTLDDKYLAPIVAKAEDLGDLIAIAQHPSRRVCD